MYGPCKLAALCLAVYRQLGYNYRMSRRRRQKAPRWRPTEEQIKERMKNPFVVEAVRIGETKRAMRLLPRSGIAFWCPKIACREISRDGLWEVAQWVADSKLRESDRWEAAHLWS